MQLLNKAEKKASHLICMGTEHPHLDRVRESGNHSQRPATAHRVPFSGPYEASACNSMEAEPAGLPPIEMGCHLYDSSTAGTDPNSQELTQTWRLTTSGTSHCPLSVP